VTGIVQVSVTPSAIFVGFHTRAPGSVPVSVRRHHGCTGARRGPGRRWHFLVAPFGFLLLQVRGIGQHHFAQIHGRPVGVDRPAVAALDQQRQPAGMIDVGMGDDHRIERLRVEAELVMVVPLMLAAALDQAAFDQYSGIAGCKQERRAGDLAGRPEELQFHELISL
jgi:hypothetical protein